MLLSNFRGWMHFWQLCFLGCKINATIDPKSKYMHDLVKWGIQVERLVILNQSSHCCCIFVPVLAWFDYLFYVFLYFWRGQSITSCSTIFCTQRYMQQFNEVELSALGMGTVHRFSSFLFFNYGRCTWFSSIFLVDSDMFLLLVISPQRLIFSAIATVVTVAEILKNNGLAVERSTTC